jgi:hypothetical protein
MAVSMNLVWNMEKYAPYHKLDEARCSLMDRDAEGVEVKLEEDPRGAVIVL